MATPSHSTLSIISASGVASPELSTSSSSRQDIERQGTLEGRKVNLPLGISPIITPTEIMSARAHARPELKVAMTEGMDASHIFQISSTECVIPYFADVASVKSAQLRTQKLIPLERYKVLLQNLPLLKLWAFDLYLDLRELVKHIPKDLEATAFVDGQPQICDAAGCGKSIMREFCGTFTWAQIQFQFREEDEVEAEATMQWWAERLQAIKDEKINGFFDSEEIKKNREVFKMLINVRRKIDTGCELIRSEMGMRFFSVIPAEPLIFSTKRRHSLDSFHKDQIKKADLIQAREDIKILQEFAKFCDSCLDPTILTGLKGLALPQIGTIIDDFASALRSSDASSAMNVKNRLLEIYKTLALHSKKIHTKSKRAKTKTKRDDFNHVCLYASFVGECLNGCDTILFNLYPNTFLTTRLLLKRIYNNLCVSHLGLFANSTTDHLLNLIPEGLSTSEHKQLNEIINAAHIKINECFDRFRSDSKIFAYLDQWNILLKSENIHLLMICFEKLESIFAHYNEMLDQLTEIGDALRIQIQGVYNGLPTSARQQTQWVKFVETLSKSLIFNFFPLIQLLTDLDACSNLNYNIEDENLFPKKIWDFLLVGNEEALFPSGMAVSSVTNSETDVSSILACHLPNRDYVSLSEHKGLTALENSAIMPTYDIDTRIGLWHTKPKQKSLFIRLLPPGAVSEPRKIASTVPAKRIELPKRSKKPTKEKTQFINLFKQKQHKIIRDLKKLGLFDSGGKGSHAVWKGKTSDAAEAKSGAALTMIQGGSGGSQLKRGTAARMAQQLQSHLEETREGKGVAE